MGDERGARDGTLRYFLCGCFQQLFYTRGSITHITRAKGSVPVFVRVVVRTNGRGVGVKVDFFGDFGSFKDNGRTGRFG